LTNQLEHLDPQDWDEFGQASGRESE